MAVVAALTSPSSPPGSSAAPPAFGVQHNHTGNVGFHSECGRTLACPRRRVRGRDRRHAAARRAHRHRRRGRGDRDRAARARSGPDLVPYTLSARARLHRADVPPDTRFVPLPARVLLRSWAAPRHAAHRLVAAPRARRPRDELPRAPEPAADARQRVRLLVRALSGAVHAGGACVRADPPARDRLAARRCTPARRSSPTRSRRSSAPGCARPGRLVVIPLGVPALGDASRLPADVAARVDRRAVRARDRHARTAQELRRTSSARSASSRRATPTLRLVIAGHDGPARPAVDAAIARLPARRARACRRHRRRRRRGRGARCSTRAAVLAYPSIYEGFGFPVLEAMSVGRARGRGARRFDSRGRGRRRAARRTDRRARARRRRSNGSSPTTRRAPS